MLKKLKKIILIIISSYVVGCISLFLLQDEILFVTNDIHPSYKFNFQTEFEELFFDTEDSIAQIHALHFKVSQPKGIVLFFHGNSGNNQTWGGLSKFYVERDFEVLFFDYRDYGKSTGKIISEAQLISDGQIAYNYVASMFDESDIILSGTSMGSGIATQIAQRNSPKLLILNAPFYSLRELVKSKTQIFPDFLLKYKLDTYKYIADVDCPIEVFHGSNDNLIPLENSKRLKVLNKNIQTHVCEGAGHNSFYSNRTFINRMNEIFN